MSILIVDDDSGIRKVLKLRLIAEGFETTAVPSAKEAFHFLRMGEHQTIEKTCDLILMDILMPDLGGIEACRRIKADSRLRDVPVILMTASSDDQHLEEAFNAGATDYIPKPFKKVELLARIRSALRLKLEIDKRKRREKELTETARELRDVNLKLAKLSSIDGLTSVYNRRYFDAALAKEFKRAFRNQETLSLIMIDIDGFKAFNDLYGHQLGDDCLKRIAGEFKSIINRSHEFVARYGGEEFVAMLPETSEEGARQLAEKLRAQIIALKIEHAAAPVGKTVTISLGTASKIPGRGATPEGLVSIADQALYQSKARGRNRVTSGLSD